MSDRTFLVTGSMGCIGAWVIHHLVKREESVVAFDLSSSRHRIDLLLSRAEQERVEFVQGDLVDLDQVQQVFETRRVTHAIHLGALQVPFCRADPVQGARVNVVGTTNMLEAARRGGLGRLVYASSVAVYGPASDYAPGPLPADARLAPRTHYGAYKQCNELTAQAYWRESGLSSVGLRPHTVYGLGRDQGVTSDPTKAMLAAAAGKAFKIQFANRVQLQWASDVAAQFIEASLEPLEGARVFNLGGETVSMSEMVDLIRRVVPSADLSVSDARLPFPESLEDTELRGSFRKVHQISLEAGVRATIDAFQRCLAGGLVKPQ